MEPLEDEFGDIIQKARKGLGLTVAQVARMTDLSPYLIEEMESYRHKPSEKEAISIAGALGLDSVRLFAIADGTWHPPELLADRLSDIVMIDGSVGTYRVKGYILIAEESKEAVAFDTANSSKKILASLQDRGLRLKYIFLTHCHSDHTGGIEEICRVTGAAAGIPDGEPAGGLEKDIKRWALSVKDDSEFMIGSTVIKAVATPGHTQGSTCYITPDYCFSGDTIFAGSVGRSYSAEGYKRMLRSVRSRILSLKEDVLIFPGHGPATTVGEEGLHNPFF